MNNIGQDIRYALRGLRKSPGFAVIAIVTLALGIGANTAIFTVINAVFFHPIPVKDPKSLVEIFTVDQRRFFGLTNNFFPSSYPNNEDIQRRAQSFDGMAISSFGFARVSMTVNGQPNQYFAQLVSGNFFDVLGVRAQLGRTFPSGGRPGDGGGTGGGAESWILGARAGRESKRDWPERPAERAGIHHYWRGAKRISGNQL